MAQARRWRAVQPPIAERVERIGDVERLWVSVAHLGRPWYWAIVHRVGGVLIDSGPSHARAAVSRFVAQRPLDAVLTTHLHEDHVGNHEVLPPGVPVWAPQGTLPLLEHGPPPIPLYRRLTWGTHGAAPGARAVGDKVDAGARRFRVIPTPGHSADHVAYFDEEASIVFAGDAFLGKPRIARDAEDVHTEVESLRRLADLDADLLLSGHTPPLRKPRETLLDGIAYYEELARRAWKLHDAGKSARQIRRELLGREPLLTYFSGFEFSAEKMVTNLLRRRVEG